MAALLAGVCLAAAGAAAAAPATTPPSKGVDVNAGATAAPSPQAAKNGRAEPPPPSPAPARPATTRPAPVRSEVGHTLIRRGDAAAPSTQPASPSTSNDPATPFGAPSLGLSRVAGALALVLALIFALRSVMKRAFGVAGAAGTSRSVVVLSRTVLAPKQQVMLLRVGRRLIVVGDSGGQMSTLSEITDPDEVAALVGQLKDEKLSSAAPAFGGLLGRLRSGMEAGGASSSDTNRQQYAATANDDDVPGDGIEDDPEGDPARQEISGLLARVRLISNQFKAT